MTKSGFPDAILDRLSEYPGSHEYVGLALQLGHAFVDAAETAIKNARGKFGEVYAKALAEHRTDVDRFTFDCERFGDFLQIRISRGGLKYAATLNLMKAPMISLMHGAPTSDRGGELRFSFQQEDRDKWEVFEWGGSAPTRLLGLQEPSGNPYWGNVSNSFAVNIPETPRFAMDDTLIFAGLGHIPIPCGRGEDVERQVLEEIARGYERAKP